MEVKMTQHADFLVIGSGLAGLSFAMRAARKGSVLVLLKKTFDESASDKAQGGIASVMSTEDSFAAHEEDTLRSGAGVCHPDVVRLCIQSAPQAIQELIDLGVPFSQDDSNHYDLGKEGGHSRRRILHAGDFTGHEIMDSLINAAKKKENIRFLEHHIGINLIVDSESKQCRGAYALNRNTRQIETFLGRCTVLATGGAGKVYIYTSNPDVASGDGMAMAYRAGAEMANMEFVQFHPTCLYHPKAKSFLLSEALRGEGGVLKLANGEEFLSKYDKRGSLATRDIVARAIDHELKKSGDNHVSLDLTSVDPDYLIARFPNIHKRCLSYSLDMTREPLPVVPAAHYFCGGIRTDSRGRSSIPGLYAIGETACTGFHGANRLASNSLLEAAVFGKRAAIDAIAWIDQVGPLHSEPSPWDPGDAVDSDEMVVVSQNWNEIRRFMMNYVGIVRSDKRLERAQRRIRMVRDEIRQYYWDFLLTPDLIELRNIAVVAELVIHSALARKESRGLHHTLDYPEMDDTREKKDTIMEMGRAGLPCQIDTRLPSDWS
jgi:L-aspartate oxidase